MKTSRFKVFAGSSLLALAAASGTQTASAQDASADVMALEEIVVTARRKDESIQDVPTTINAVTGEDIQKLNFRDFKEIASVVPGLTMSSNANGVGASATVRGVNYDVNASGNNGTVEFYWNDAPISAGNLFQAMYDIQQVELLRGPQGTLRGRASPSGSMTVTTRRPDLQEAGGYVSATGTDIGGYNGQGAFGIPVISDVLAIRVAGTYEKNEGNRVKSYNNSADPESKTKSGRATIRFEPTDSLSFILTYQKTKQDTVTNDQVESQQVLFPNAPNIAGAVAAGTAAAFGGAGNPAYSAPFIRASDRRAVSDIPRTFSQDFDNYNFQAQWAFLGQKLNYVGQRNEQHFLSFEPNDVGDFWNPTITLARFHQFGQNTDSNAKTTAHELRLSSEEMMFGMFDYILGAFYQKGDFPTDLSRPVPLLGSSANVLYVQRRGGNKEQSVFANLTAHVTESTEISAGARYIDFNNTGDLYANNPGVIGSPITYNPAAHEDSNFNTVIYSATVKQNFTDDFMAYATFGTSWRPGISVIGDFNPTKTALENSFLILKPEKSKSYELGFKATALDKRLRANLSLYFQDFDNFVYRSASGVYFIDQTRGGAVNAFNFVAGVPAEVKGAELDVAFAPLSMWDVGVVASYSDGKIKNGVVPCNDYSPRDGIPDGVTVAAPSAGTITATGDVLSGCRVNYRASISPLWSASLHSEVRFPIAPWMDGYVRGLLSMYGDSQNDPANPLDDYSAYELLNVYLGVRDPDGVWEASLYGKNVTDKEVVLQRSATLMNGGSASLLSNYYGGTATTGLVMTAPREFGVTLRYNFGSK